MDNDAVFGCDGLMTRVQVEKFLAVSNRTLLRLHSEGGPLEVRYREGYKVFCRRQVMAYVAGLSTEAPYRPGIQRNRRRQKPPGTDSD